MSEHPNRPNAIVLIVEDEPIQRMALQDLIEEGGFDVVEAWDAASAIQVLETRTDIRLVVTDVEMPGSLDGMKLAAAVRDRWPPIEIVLVSAQPAPDVEILPVRVEFIPKPIAGDDLLAILTRLERSVDNHR